MYFCTVLLCYILIPICLLIFNKQCLCPCLCRWRSHRYLINVLLRPGNSLLARRQGDSVALFSSILLSSRKHNNGFVGNKYHFRNLYINSIIRHGKTDTRLHPNNKNAISLECYYVYALRRLFVRIKIWLLFSALISNGGTSTVIVKGKRETFVKYHIEKATCFNSRLTRQIWYASLLEYSSRQVHKQHHSERCQNMRVTRRVIQQALITYKKMSYLVSLP